MIDPRHVGRSYGPFRYAVGQEEIRDFAVVLAGGVPGRAFASEPPEMPHPYYVNEAVAGASPHRGIVAPPTFCVRFAIEPFARALCDRELGLDLARIVHGEQALELLEVVRPGDVLETRGEITSVREKSGMDFITVRTTSVNQLGRVAVVGTWTAIVLPGG